MNQKKHTVLAIFTAKPGKEKELETALRAMIEPSLAEEGCINYDLHQSTTNKNEFMFYENWVSKEAHEKHGTSAHIQEWRKKKNELLETNNSVSGWKMLD